MSDRDLRIRMVLEGLDRITKPLKAVTGASANARKALSDTQKELKGLAAAQQDVGRFKGMEGNWQATNRELATTDTRLAELRRQLAATEAPSKKLRTEFERTERQSAALRGRLDQQGNELQQLGRKLTAAGLDVNDLAKHEDRLADRTYEANKRLKQQQAQIEKVSRASKNSERLNEISGKAAIAGTGMIGAGVASATPVVLASRQAMTLEESMAGVSKVTGMAGADLQRMSNDMLDLSQRIPMTADGLGNIAAAAGAAGVGMDKLGQPMRDQRQQLMEFTNDAAEMGIAFDMAAEDAGSTMAKWRTAFGLPQQSVRDLGDRVNALTNIFGGKAVNVTDILTRIGPLGKVAGLAAPQIAALGSTLDSIGVESEIAATGIKNTMLALTKGDAATKSQVEAFQSLGLSATNVAKRMQKDAAGTIVDVMERIGKLKPEKQAGMLTRLFGSESVTAIAPLLTNLDGLKARLALVGDKSRYAGSMHGEFLNRIATTQGATDLALNGLSALNITLGTALLPTIQEISGKVLEASKSVRGWAQEHPQLTKAIMMFLAVGSGLLILLGGMALAFAALTMAAAPLGIALLPLLLIVAAVAAVAAAAYMIYANWGAISAWFAGLWETIKGIFSTAINALVQAFLNFTPLGLLIQALSPAIAYLRSLNLMEIGRNLIQGLINGISSMLGALKSTIVNAASAASNWFKQKLGIHSPSRVFAQFGGFMMEGLEGGIAAGQSAPIQRVTGIASDITRALAVGAAAPAVASVTAAPTQAASAPAAMGPVTIVIQQQPGQNGADLARLVREEFEALKRQEQAAQRSSFSDTSDYGAFA
ncbi:MAG TPA: phage tail tape measure protein [Sphingobium sp.]|uniref:phage tail tape measure protein n=1 Tax=Sphingobium sp. TaxID=1912891 RepID=UPI002ED45FD0